jgi:hypothetical protein
MKITSVGLDLGNTRTKLCIDDKCISIPSIYAHDKPIVVGKSGQEVKAKCFSLINRQWIDKEKNQYRDFNLWFGPDVLASQNTIHKLKEAKYNPGHISILFRAALHQWSKQHKVNLSDLGKFNIVVSMPPGLYQQGQLRMQALKAYRKAFNRGQSHVKIRDGKDTVQIVSQFQSLVREAVCWGKNIPRKGEWVLVYDMGGETDDMALFNGSTEPAWSMTKHIGLLHTFDKIDPVNPGLAELKVLRNKNNLPVEMVSHYNRAENNILKIKSHYPNINRLYIIGGGASLMKSNKNIKAMFTSLAKQVIIKDEFANCRANWLEASK